MILKETLRQVVKRQFEQIESINSGIERELLKDIDHVSPHVIIISGIRRCGKSTLLLQIMKSLDNYYYFNFEDPRVVSFEVADFLKLDGVFHEEFGESQHYFFDEIQNVPDWERYIRTLQDQGKKVYITGSNASLLSRELGSRLTGRHLMYELFPFSYTEMLKLTDQSASLTSFNDYTTRGGFPEFLKYKNPAILHQLFQDIVIRDIIARYKLREHQTLLELALYLTTNNGNEYSHTRLKNQFQLGSTNTAISYLSYLEDSYLVCSLPRFSYSFSRQRSYARKIYSIDPGLSNANSASFSGDFGRHLESIVFLQLKRRYKSIYYLKNDFECDFLIKEGSAITTAIQVCYQLTGDNLQQEITGIKKAIERTGARKGVILTQNQDEIIDEIPVIPTWKWCLENMVN